MCGVLATPRMDLCTEGLLKPQSAILSYRSEAHLAAYFSELCPSGHLTLEYFGTSHCAGLYPVPSTIPSGLPIVQSLVAWHSGPRLSGHQVIRGVVLYRSCSSQGTEVYLLLHGPGHFLGVAFGILAQLGLCVTHICQQALLWPDCTLSQLVCMFSLQ